MVIVYNGEVYNADDLRRGLAAAGRSRLQGHSDTEVIVEACALWGVGDTIRRLIGMFAIAIWDRETATLSLVRDRPSARNSNQSAPTLDFIPSSTVQRSQRICALATFPRRIPFTPASTSWNRE